VTPPFILPRLHAGRARQHSASAKILVMSPVEHGRGARSPVSGRDDAALFNCGELFDGVGQICNPAQYRHHDFA
jgi:hypothetical protein